MLTSCSFGGGGIMYISDEKNADKRMEQILSAIKDEDKEGMKALFSKQALDETDDFDKGVDYLYDFIQGDVESWERYTLSAGEKIKHGKKSVMIRSWYTVSTEKEDYLFFVLDYAKDTITPDNEGLYTLRVIKSEDEEKEFTYWQDMMLPGIYIPKE